MYYSGVLMSVLVLGFLKSLKGFYYTDHSSASTRVRYNVCPLGSMQGIFC